MMLVMEDLAQHMQSRPRYWRRLLTVLVKTCQGDAPSLILQVHAKFLVGVTHMDYLSINFFRDVLLILSAVGDLFKSFLSK